jgi:hypothetical protein
MIIIRILSFLLGFAVAASTFFSAVRTFVLPRSAPDLLSRIVFLCVRWLFDLRLSLAQSYKERDRIMAFFAPASLLALLPTWLFLVTVGYMFMYWGLGIEPWQQAFVFSGSSILTLGFATATTLPQMILAFTEATAGLILVAMLISYLPTMYSAFARRETAVTLLEVRAGSPPSAVEMLTRFYRLHRLDQLNGVWLAWETWFAEVEENHTSLAALVFFRSPQPDHSWVTAAGAVLDAAGLTLAVVAIPHDVQADLCIRAGYLALRRIADFFRLPYNPKPHYPDDPISVSRAEFEAACDSLAAAGLPLQPDRDQAWRVFAGWRVNYDRVLIALCSLTVAPEAPWSSDRAAPFVIPVRLPWRRRGSFSKP